MLEGWPRYRKPKVNFMPSRGKCKGIINDWMMNYKTFVRDEELAKLWRNIRKRN